MDNFEWNIGYLKRYGLYHVDFSNPNRPRNPKASAGFYRRLVTENRFEAHTAVMGGALFEDEFLYGQFPEDFIWSTSSASYQIEGGWNEGGPYFSNHCTRGDQKLRGKCS